MENILNDSADGEEDSRKDRYLAFAVGDESYAVDIARVVEIVGLQPITEEPELPPYMKGVVDLRGSIIPVMDMRLRFKKPPAAYDERTCMVIVTIRDAQVGLIVDSVSDVLTIPEADVACAGQLDIGRSRYIRGIGKTEGGIRIIIDCDELLDRLQ